jgi:ribosomal protein S18 acetylase RimI-like enzyme
MAPGFQLSVDCAVSEEDRATIERGLVDHARSLGIDSAEQERIAVCLRDTNGVLRGGLVGGIMWGWLEISLLWIDEGIRARGHGAILLDTGEMEAARRGCHHARLETFNVEALRFYRRRGYEEYGAIPDCPMGHTRYLLMKDLRRLEAAV